MKKYIVSYYAPRSDPDGRGTGLNLSITIEAGSITEALDIFKGSYPQAYNIYARKAKKTSNLFAAAPDMLAALQNLVERDLIAADNDHYDEVLDAIAKAKGENNWPLDPLPR